MDGRAPIDRDALARIMPIWPHETDAELMAIIPKTLVNMRRQGLDSNWAYHKARHSNLLAFYEALKRDRAILFGADRTS